MDRSRAAMNLDLGTRERAILAPNAMVFSLEAPQQSPEALDTTIRANRTAVPDARDDGRPPDGEHRHSAFTSGSRRRVAPGARSDANSPGRVVSFTDEASRGGPRRGRALQSTLGWQVPGSE